MALRVAIGNHKGGAGKTAATVNLSAELAGQGHRVLVVDLDPQANASRRLGVPRFDPENPTVTVSEVLTHSTPGITGAAADAIVPCGWAFRGNDPRAGRISVIPSRFDLENRISEAATVGAVKRLARALDGVDDDYDVTIFDCPPSLGHLTHLGLAAADVALCSLEPEYDSVEGAIRFMNFIENSVPEFGNAVELIGVLVARVRAIGAHTFQVEHLSTSFPEELLWEPHIPDRAPIKDAADAAAPLPGGPDSELRSIFLKHAKRLATYIPTYAH